MAKPSQLLLIFLLFVTSLQCSPEKNNEHVQQNSSQIINKEKSKDIIITAVGDIMMGTNYPSESSMPPRDAFLLRPVTEALKKGDIIFGNLEGPILDSGGVPKTCGDPASCYVFRQPSYFVKELKDAGFNLFSIANNHVSDLGEPGRLNTISKELQKIVKKLDSFCDIVIVSFHGGAEGQSHTHVPRKHEMFLGQDRGDVYAFARQAIDAGADVVLGHGPHITRAIDMYKGRFIAYSMGNFCTYEKFNIKGISGMAPIFELRVSSKGEFLEGKVVSTRQFGRGGPVIDEEQSVIEEIKRLTAEDVPEIDVKFNQNTFTIYPKD